MPLNSNPNMIGAKQEREQSAQNGATYLSPQEVADRFGVSRRTIYNWIKDEEPGFDNFTKFGGRWRIRERDLP